MRCYLAEKIGDYELAHSMGVNALWAHCIAYQQLERGSNSQFNFERWVWVEKKSG